MGDWDDLCESLGLDPSVEWEEVEPYLCLDDPTDRPPPRQTLTAFALSEQDRPIRLPEAVITAFVLAGVQPPNDVGLHQYSYRFWLQTGGHFDLWYGARGQPTAFAVLGATPQQRAEIRAALQMHLSRPAPAEVFKWSRARERLLRRALWDQGWKGLWVDHKPLKTLVGLRRSRYRLDATSPGFAISKRVGVIVLKHDDEGETKILSRHGDAELQSRLVDGLIVFGLIGVQSTANGSGTVHGAIVLEKQFAASAELSGVGGEPSFRQEEGGNPSAHEAVRAPSGESGGRCLDDRDS